MRRKKNGSSTLTMLERCGEMFRRRYIEREYVPPLSRMLRGEAEALVLIVVGPRRAAGGKRRSERW